MEENEKEKEFVSENEEQSEESPEENSSEETPEDEDWKSRYEEMNDKYLRLYSEFDNFRRRTQKEKLELYRTAGEDIMAALLPVLDDFERAEKSMSDKADPASLKKGVDLIYQKLFSILKQKGLSRMENPVGKEFDLENQEAITRIPAPEKKLKGKVIDEVEPGYKLNEKVIRFSKVVVGE